MNQKTGPNGIPCESVRSDSALALVCGLFGQHIPGEFGHSGTPLESFFGTLTIAEGGLWGSLSGVSVNVVAIFVIFGAVLNAVEAGQGFMNMDLAAVGRLKGGAAQVWVLSSAFFGSISGSASTNVASTSAITSAFFLFPFSVLMWGMFGAGLTSQYGAALAILCASLVVGVLSITGLGVKITSLILSGTDGLLWPYVLLNALACLILGTEVPTTSAYVICVSVAGTALILLGLDPLQAHLFVFWFALLSTITPPVCGAVFIAAGMVGEKRLRAALCAMSLGIGLYVIPLGMIANPTLIQLSSQPTDALFSALKVGLDLTVVSYGVIGRYGTGWTIALIVIGMTLILTPFGRDRRPGSLNENNDQLRSLEVQKKLQRFQSDPVQCTLRFLHRTHCLNCPPISAERLNQETEPFANRLFQRKPRKMHVGSKTHR